MKKKNEKKILLLLMLTLIIILCAVLLTWYFKKPNNKKYLQQLENTYASIDHYAIYGTHFNLSGTLAITNVSNVEFILGNQDEEMTLPLKYKQEEIELTFKTSDYINGGINLETLKNGEYYFLLKVTVDNNIKYYSLENKTEYQDLTYYTLTKKKANNFIALEWNTYEECPTLRFKSEKKQLPKEVYDIAIDPGHGGIDVGAVGSLNGKDYYERDLNLAISLALKSQLEQQGYKVAITRENNDKVYIYQKYGSATLANDVKAKFNFAIHHNSNGTGTNFTGLEVYMANDSKFDLARLLVENITVEATTKISNKPTYKKEDGIYIRNFTEEEIEINRQEALELNFEPSPVTTETPYYYYIREVGGISTHAYVDGRNPNYPANEHYNSNNTAESYLLELGYVDNTQSLQNLIDNTNGYAKGIALALESYLT